VTALHLRYKRSTRNRSARSPFQHHIGRSHRSQPCLTKTAANVSELRLPWLPSFRAPAPPAIRERRKGHALLLEVDPRLLQKFPQKSLQNCSRSFLRNLLGNPLSSEIFEEAPASLPGLLLLLHKGGWPRAPEISSEISCRNFGNPGGGAGQSPPPPQRVGHALQKSLQKSEETSEVLEEAPVGLLLHEGGHVLLRLRVLVEVMRVPRATNLG